MVNIPKHVIAAGAGLKEAKMTEINLAKHKAELEKTRAKAFISGQEAMREAAARAVETKAALQGRQECCGFGVGSPPECCGDPLFMISDREAAWAIRFLLTDPSPWRPISEAPKDGTRVIGLTVYGPEIVKWSAYGEWIGTEQDSTCLPSVVTRGDAQHQPTHWMPLPAPPTDEDR